MHKSFIKYILILIMVFILPFGCNRGPEAKPKVEKKTKVAISTINTMGDSYKVFKATIEEKAKKEKMEIIWLDSQDNVLKQSEDLKKAIEDKPKVVVIEPVDPKLISKSIEDIQREGIKVLTINYIPENIAVDGYIAPDFQRAGEMQAQQMLSETKLEQPGEILILRGTKDDQVFEKIVSGNLNILQENKKIKEIWLEEVPDGKMPLAYNTVKKYLDNNKIPKAILAHSPEMTMATIQAVEEKGMSNKIDIYGMGTAMDAVEALEKGMHTGEIDLMPDVLAQTVLQAVKNLSNDEPWEYEQQIQNGQHNVPARFIPIRSITKENVYLLKERMEMLKKEEKKEKEKEGKKEEEQQSNSEGGNPEEGEKQQGGQKEEQEKTIVKIKTKDGQEFEMNIKGQVESIEMKSEKEQQQGGQEQEGGEQGGQ